MGLVVGVVLCLFFSVSAFLFATPAQATAGINDKINFQGKLTNTDGTNVTDGSAYELVFKLYNVSSGGSNIWTETQTAQTVTNGVFQVQLGSVTSLSTVDFNNTALYLGIQVTKNAAGGATGDSEMTPRLQFAAVPYAFNAQKVNGLAVTNNGGNTLNIAASKTLTVNNTITLNGTDSTTFTLPTTSGGTVLTSNAPTQTITSTQTSGTGLAFSDATNITGAVVGQSISLSGTGAFDQTGLQFNLSGATGTNLNDIVGSGSTWKVSKSGALTVTSCSGCSGAAVGALSQVPTSVTPGAAGANVVAPTAAGITGMIINTTTNATTADALDIITAHTSGTTVNAALISQAAAGTTTNGLKISRSSGTLSNGLVFDGTIGSDITTGTSGRALTIATLGAGAITVDPGSGAALNLGNTNANAVTLGNTTNTATVAINSSATTGNGITLTDTALTTGNALKITVADPEANSNAGTLSTGKIINIASTNHSYLTLDNKDLTIGGHKTNVTLSGVTDVYLYDTSSDMDGGKWTDGARAQASSWYNETLDDAGTDCNIATMDRCDQRAFPNKAVIVSTATSVYIFDAANNVMWMRFDKGATTTENMIGPTSNSTVSSLFALNGKLYVGNAGSVGQLFSINFISDIAKKYNATDDYQGNLKVGSRNTTATWVSSIGQALPGTVINDLNGNIINGKVYIAVALEPTSGSANGSVSIINETDQTVINFGVAANNTASKNVFLTTAGDFYATIGNATTISGSTNFFIKAKHQMFNLATNSNNNSFSEIYGNVGTGATQYGVSLTDAAFGSVSFTNGPAPVDATFIPNSMYVTSGTSIDNGKSNTILVGNNDNLTVIQEKQGTAITTVQQANVKYYTKDYISEYMFSDIRGMWPMSSTGSLNDVSVKANAALTNNNTATFTSGVRGTGVSLNGSNQYLSLADNTALSVTGALTFGAWFKTTSTSTQQYILSKNGSYTLQVTATGKVQADITGASSASRISLNSIDTGWHHVVAIYNPAGSSLDIYLDGILTNGTLTGTVPTAITDSANAWNIGANNGATFFSGQIDEAFVTADAIDPSIIKSMYRVGYRALSQHGTDLLQQLVGSSSQVNAVAVDIENGTIIAGTAGGGVTEIGSETDSQVSTYTTSGPADDTGTNFANATINSVAIGRGFGNGDITAIGNGSGVWLESADTAVKDFMSQSYNPFGNTLVQSTLNVDNVLRVTNQISTRLDNLAAYGSPQIGLQEFFRADANGVAATNYRSTSGALNLQSGITDPSIKFLDPNGGIGGSIVTASQYGTGADGAVTFSSGTNNINTTSLSGTGGRTYADGIAYRVVPPAIYTNSVARYAATDKLTNGLAVGDEVLVINLQGNVGDIADVGKYQVMRIAAITPSLITFEDKFNSNLTGTTPANQKVIVQRIPNYTNVTLTGTAVITASTYDGLATLPTGNAGYQTGIVAFRANGTVSIGTGTSITVKGLGYRGGAAGNAAITTGAISGETIDSLTLTDGSGVGAAGFGATAARAAFGGGQGGNQVVTNPANGATTGRGGGGGGGASGNGVSTAGGGGGAGGGYGTAGGGGGGSGSTASSAGGGAGATAGGGGGGSDTAGTGGAGGTAAAGATATGGTGLGVGGTIGTATTNGSGGGGANNAVGGGAGGGGGAGYGAAPLTAGIYLGSGGGGGGGSTDTATAGGAGGNGGGMVMLFGSTITITSTGAINAQGNAGTAGTTNSGAGGSGAGGSVYIQGQNVTLGTTLVTAAAVAGTTKVGKGGGGGGGGVGRINTTVGNVAISGTTTPAANAVTGANTYGILNIRTTNTQAGDLAENYATGDLGIEPGDLVEMASAQVTNSDGETIVPKGVLMKAATPYSNKIMGIISTAPGILLSEGNGESADQRKLALTGKVPVKVSTLNGPIHVGDYLTASTHPGVAMKATKAGTVVAQAMEDYDSTDVNSVGTITGFVKAAYYNGQSTQEITNAVTPDPTLTVNTTPSQLLLTQLINENSLQATDSATLSELVTDRIAAGIEVVTPRIVTQDIFANGMLKISGLDGTVNSSFDNQGNATFSGTLYANVIKANQIEGLNIYTNQLSSLTSKVNGLATATTSAGLVPSPSPSATPNGNIFSTIAQFLNDVIYKGNVQFFGRATFNSDSAGFALIKPGASEVQVTFTTPFSDAPVVVVSPDKNVQFAVTDVDVNKFLIKLNQAAAENIRFSWTATAVNGAKTFESTVSGALATPTPSITPSLLPTPSNLIIPSLEPTPSPVTASPTTSPVATSSAGSGL